MRTLRGLLVPLRLVAARLRNRPLRGALVVAGVAAATAMLVGVVGGGLIAGEGRARSSLEALPPGDRTFTLATASLRPDAGWRALDDEATGALGQLAPTPPVRLMLLREISLDRGVVRLGALQDLERWVRLESGRLPTTCTPRRCEVVEIGAAGLPVGREAGIEPVVVGRGGLVSDVPFGGAFRPAGPGDPPRPFLLAGSVEELSALPGAAGVYRSYGWLLPIDPTALRGWDVGALLAREARVQGALEPAFDLTAPDRTLLEARAAGRAAQRRLLLVGASVAGLLLAFVVVAGGGARRDLGAEWRRLERRGARGSQLGVLALADAGVATAVGVVAGTAIGVGVVAEAARRSGLDAGEVLGRSVLAPSGVALVLVAWVVATTVLIIAAARRLDGPRLGPLGPADLVGLAALAVLAVAAARGGATAAELTSGQVDPLVPLLPLLVLPTAGIAVARLVPPLLRAAERAARGTPVHLALLSMARQPGRPAVTVAFLSVGLGVALFALGYRSTLAEGRAAQAAFAEPLDVRVTAGRDAVAPLDAAPLESYRSLAPGATVLPVVRTRGTVPTTGSARRSVPVIGVPADALGDLDGLRRALGAPQARALGDRLEPPFAPDLIGAALPPEASSLTLAARAGVQPWDLGLVVRTPRGTIVTLALGTAPATGTVLRAGVPERARGGDVVAIQLRATDAAAASAAHQGAEDGADATIERGTVLIGALRADGADVTDWSGWQGRTGAEAVPEAGGLRLTYTGGGGTSLIRPPHPTDTRPLPVVVTPDVAAGLAGGRTLRLAFAGDTLTARVVGTIPRLPGVGSSAVLADGPALSAALDADRPGSGVPRELWIGADDPAALESALERPPFAGLERSSRRAVAERLADDPLARGTLLVLLAAAAVAPLLALIGVALASSAELRDESGALLDLEAQGVPPRTLRRGLRLGAVLTAVLGVVGGTVVGVLLTRSVVDLLLLTASAEPPQPPLVAQIDWAVAAVAAACFLLLALVATALVTRSAFRGPVAGRAAGTDL